MTCADCEKEFTDALAIEINTGEVLCKNCAFGCDGCANFFREVDLQDFRQGWYCQQCIWNRS